MKNKHFLLIMMLIGSCQLWAQQPDSLPSRRRITYIIRHNRNGEALADTIEVNKVDPFEKRKIKRISKEWTIDVGMNNYLEKGGFPSSEGKEYGVKFGLDYIALSTNTKIHIGGQRNPLFFIIGPEISWNALMFEADKEIREKNGKVSLEIVENSNGQPEKLRKSKLGITYLSIPASFTLDFDKTSRHPFRIGLGGYIGLRIRSWSKVKLDDGEKIKRGNNSGFYINDFRYGIMGEAGYRGIRLFIKYDLNPLFKKGKGFDPNMDLNVLNIGIRI
jgi:hypothetical protein